MNAVASFQDFCVRHFQTTESKNKLIVLVAFGAIALSASIAFLGLVGYLPVIVGGIGGAAFIAFSITSVVYGCTLRVSSQALKSISPHPFKISYTSEEKPYYGPISIATANLGLLPSIINTFQQIGHGISKLHKPSNRDLLCNPSKRIDGIVEKLISLQAPILCCQEVFDSRSNDILVQRLNNEGYTVLHSGHAGFKFVNSGLLFATRHSIQEEGIRFWRYTNLIIEDNLSSKGLLRIPLKVSLEEEAEPLDVIIYTTHLQAQIVGEQARKEQIEDILSIIREDAKENSHPIFLIGDLNITDIEYGEISHNEYTRRASFFSHFHDFMDLTYDRQTGIKIDSADSSEPTGTFYNMNPLASKQPSRACYYDRVLRYRGNGENQPPPFTIAISKAMDGGLSDHFPLTCTLPSF